METTNYTRYVNASSVHSSKITMSRDNTIKVCGHVIGTWKRTDMWKKYHCNTQGRDRSGYKLVHYLYSIALNNGRTAKSCFYTLNECREYVADICTGCTYIIND